MRGRRTTVVQVLVALLATTATAATSACDLAPSRPDEPLNEPAGDATLVAVDSGSGDPPELTEELEVELGTAVAVYSRGCRPRTVLQRCSPDGTQTYTLAGPLRAATAVGVWMQLDTGRGRWALHVRLDPEDARVVAGVGDRAEEHGGLAVVLAAHTGDVLAAIPSPGIRGVTITQRDLPKPAAEAVVDAFVAAATKR